MSTASSRKRKSGAQRTVWRTDYFHDHPGYNADRVANSSEVSKTQGGKAKVYCKACFDHHVAHIMGEEMGQPNAQTKRQVEEFLWGLRRRDQQGEDEKLIYGHMSADLDTLINHLAACENVMPAVRQLAEEEKIQRSPGKRRKRQHQRQQHHDDLRGSTSGNLSIASSPSISSHQGFGQLIQLDSPPPGPPSSIASSSSMAIPAYALCHTPSLSTRT
ncbi:hypothetical protein HDZ31DRAFT_67224 [Schizophyllum fasciatum]